MDLINIAGSSLAASFPGLNRANGTDQLSLVATLVDTAGEPLAGAAVDFMVSPVFREDVVSATSEGPVGTYSATFTTKDASIKKVSLLVDGVAVELTAQAEMVEFDDSFLVGDPFTENVGQLSSGLTLAGQQITIKADANNSGAITEIIWNGQQLLNSLNKDRQLQTKIVKDNFGQANWARLNEAGAIRQSWSDDSSSRYIGDAQDLRHLVTQTFLAYRDPVEFQDQQLDCSGDILTKHVGMDYLGNPNIFRIDFQNDQYASNKLGATSWAVSLGLTQNFTRFYTFATSSEDNATELGLGSAVEVSDTTYMGGPIATTDDGLTALGIFRAVRAEGAQLLSAFVRARTQPDVGNVKFTNNYTQLIDFEDSAATGGLSSGKHRMERFICVGTLAAVENAFRELQYFLTQGTQSPGSGGPPPPPPTQEVDQIEVTSAPTSVTRNAAFSVSVRAVDDFGNTVTDWAGSVNVTAAPNLQLSGNAVVLFSGGVATFQDLILSGSGSGDLVFTTQTGSGPRTGRHTIAVNNEVPVLTSISPSSVPSNLNGVELRAEGTGFSTESVIYFGDTPLLTTLDSGSPAALQATVPGLNLVEGIYRVTVQNPEPGGGRSNAIEFTVEDGAPPEVLENTVYVVVSQEIATVNWQTDEPSITSIAYKPVGGVETIQTLTDPLSGDPVFSETHTIQLTSLSSPVAYEARIITEDIYANFNPEAATAAWETGDTDPPVIENVTVTPSSTSVTIEVAVSESCVVGLILSPVVPGITPQGASPRSPARFTLSGLLPSTQYNYIISATDPSANRATSSGAFTTTSGDTDSPEFVQFPEVSVSGLSATVNWEMNESCTGTFFYRQQGSTGGYSTAQDPASNPAHSVVALLDRYETIYEGYVFGADSSGNSYQSDNFAFASGPDSTGPGGGLDPSDGDLMDGDVLAQLEVKVPEGLAAGSSFIAHATIPISRPSDLSIEWQVQNRVVQRHVNSYKPRAQASSARFVHQLNSSGQITHVAAQAQFLNNVPPLGWSSSTTTPTALSWDNVSATAPAEPTVRYYSDLPAGSYDIQIKGDAAFTPAEFFYVRINGGAWQQAHGTSGIWGGYTDGTETTRLGFTVGADEVGEYLIEFGGASAAMDLERLAITPAGEAADLAPNSPVLPVSSDPTGANSVEIIFELQVPGYLEQRLDPQSGTPMNVMTADVVAVGDGALSGTAAQGGREIDQARLVMTMPKPAVDLGYAPIMDAVIAAGAGTTTKSGPYMDEVVYYTRLTDADGNAGVGVHAYVRYYKADVDDSIYVDLNITNSHVDTSLFVAGMSENAYVGNPGKIFFDQMYLQTNDVNYNIINGFGQETVTTPDGTAMTVGDPFCGGPDPADATTFFFVDYTDSPATDLTRSHNGTAGIAARSEVFHAGAQRIEQVVLRPASAPVKDDLYATEVSQYQNMGRTVLSADNRNATQELRWYGGNYFRSGELPETYVAQSPFPTDLVGSQAYDRMRMNNAGQAIKEILSTGAIQSNRDFFELGGITDWADTTQFGCWTPGGSVDGSSNKNHMMNVYETAAGPGHTRGWAFFARTVLQRHSITAFDASGDPITIRHLYGTSAQAGATANESAIQLRNDRSGQAHGWNFFYERDEWVAGRFYSRGTQVRYEGVDFLCEVSHRAIVAPNTTSSYWGVGSINQSRANQREFNGSYPIVPDAQINSGPAYPSNLIINCAYDSAWDQFTPISRDYIQRLYRCLMGLRLTVNPGIFNDYLRYQTEMYLAAEDQYIVSNVLNGGNTNDTLGHCLARFRGTQGNLGFFQSRDNNNSYASPGMQGNWGSGKAWAHWVITQSLFFTAPDEVYPAPAIGGSDYNRRSHVRDHVISLRNLIAGVMPGESAGNINPTFGEPGMVPSRRQYLNNNTLTADDAGLEDAQVIGYTVTFGGTLEQLQDLVTSGSVEDETNSNRVTVHVNASANNYPLVGYLLGASAASNEENTIWVYVPAEASAVPTNGTALRLQDPEDNPLPSGASTYVLQTTGQELDGREFTFSRAEDQHVNVHMWQCLAESLNAFDVSAARDMYRICVEYAQFDTQTTDSWSTGPEVSRSGNGTYQEWSGLVAGTSTTFAGGYYPEAQDLIPTISNQTTLRINSANIPFNATGINNQSASRDTQSPKRLPAVTGAFFPKVSDRWANLAWLAAHYSTRRINSLSEPEGLLSPYLSTNYLRTGLGYELEQNSPFLSYDINGSITAGTAQAQLALINSFVDPEERYAAKARVLASNYARSLETENWYTDAPILAEVDYLARLEEADLSGIRFSYGANTTGENEIPLEIEFTPGLEIQSLFTISNNGVPAALPTTVTLSLVEDPESSLNLPIQGRLRFDAPTFVIPANVANFSLQPALRINEANTPVYGAPEQGGIIQAVAEGGINETIIMPFRLSYPNADPSVVTFVTSNSSVPNNGTVTVAVTRTNPAEFISVPVSAVGDEGFTVSGLQSNNVDFNENVSQASFQVSYEEPENAPPGQQLTLTLDPPAGATTYTVGPDDTHVVTAQIPLAGDDSPVAVARVFAGDGAAAPELSTLGWAPDAMTLVSTTVPLIPAQATLPRFTMALGASGTPYKADVFPVTAGVNGIEVVQVSCLVPATSDGSSKVRHSIPRDAQNPEVILRRLATGDPDASYVPNSALQPVNLGNLGINLVDSDNTTYTFRASSAASREIYSGHYTRQTEYYGSLTNNTPGADDELLIVRMIVTDRSDFEAATVDVVVENSKLTCSNQLENDEHLAVNAEADGIVYFKQITLTKSSSYVSSSAIQHPSQTGNFIVRSYETMHSQGTCHGIMPGQWFSRRFALAEDAATAAAISERTDWGYVEGSLGFVQGGFGPASEGLPLMSRVSGLEYGGEVNFRAAKSRAETDEAAVYADYTTANLPSDEGILNPGGTNVASYGWFKGTSNPSTFKDYSDYRPFGVNIPAWRAAKSLMVHVDRTIERSGFAAFNTLTGYPVRDSEYRVANQVASAFNLFRHPALDINPWLWTGISYNSNVNAALAAPSRQTQQDCPYINTVGYANWQANTDSLLDPTSVTQTNRDALNGPVRGSAGSRVLQAYIPAIFLLNDRVAKILCEYDANKAMFGFGRYSQLAGGQTRSPYGAAQITFGLQSLVNSPNSPYKDGPVSTGLVLKRRAGSAGNVDVVPAEIPGVEAWAAPALAVTTAYLIGTPTTRAWIASANPNLNWFLLMGSVLRNVASENGVVGGSVANAVEVGLPKYTGTSTPAEGNGAGPEGNLPGPQQGSGALLFVTPPTGLTAQSLEEGEISLTWQYPVEGVPEPDSFTFLLNGAIASGQSVSGPTRSYLFTGLDTQQAYTINVVASYAGLSATSEPLSGITPDGFAGYEPPESIDGETDLPGGYFVPETTFDYVIDVSDDTNTSINAIKTANLEFAARIDPPYNASHIRLNGRTDPEPTRIAILLPARTETDEVSVSRTVNGPTEAEFDLTASNVEIHFVAPWASSFSVSNRENAAQEARQDAVTYEYIYDVTSSGSVDLRIDGSYENAHVGYHLWNWDIRLTKPVKLGRSVANSEFSNRVHREQDVYLHMCKITDQGYSMANGLDVELVRLQMEGVYIDLPSTTGSAITMDAVPYGDMSWRYVDVAGSGGAAIQVRNSDALDTNHTGVLRGRIQSGSPGTILLTEWYSTQFSGDSPYPMFSLEGDHHAIEFGDNTNFIVTGTNTTPILRVYNDDTADTTLGATNSSGSFCSGVRLTGSNTGFYSEDPAAGVVQVDAAMSITIGGRISVGNSATVDKVRIGTEGRGLLASTADLFNSLQITPADPGQVTNWLGASGVTGTSDISGEGGTNLVDLGPLSAAEPVYQAFTGPTWDEASGDPYVPGTAFSALSMYSAGLSRIAAKSAYAPAMIEDRDARSVSDGGFDIKAWRVDGSEPSGVFTDVSGDENFIDVSSDGKTITFADFYNDGSNMNAGQQKIMYSQYTDRSQSDQIGGETVLSREYYERPVGAKVVMDNIRCNDVSTRYYSPGDPTPPNRALKWGGRMNAMPNLHVKGCDFGTIHEEHGLYGNSEGPILIENSTFTKCTAQGTQWVHRFTENPYAENHEFSAAEPPTREVRNTHFIDCGAYGTVTARKSSNLTFQDSGYPELPCPYVKITDCTFVNGIEAFEAVADEGDGGPNGDYRYRYNKDGGIYQSSGNIQIGVEGGFFRNPHLYNNVDMQPIAQARDDDSAAVHKTTDLKNVYIHTMDPDKPVVRLLSSRNIIIEDSVIILEWREGGTAKPCLVIDGDAWKAEGERNTANPHYLFSQKLILRNSVIEVHDYRGGGAPVVTDGSIQFSNGFYQSSGYNQKLNSAQLDDYANTLGREVEFGGYYAEGQIRNTAQVNIPIYDGDIRPGHIPS